LEHRFDIVFLFQCANIFLDYFIGSVTTHIIHHPVAWVGAEYPVIRGPNGLADTVYSGHHESNIAVDIGLNHFTSMIAYRYVKIKKVNDCILETIRQLNGITVFINCHPFAVNWSADHPHEHSFHGESRRPYLRGGYNINAFLFILSLGSCFILHRRLVV